MCLKYYWERDDNCDHFLIQPVNVFAALRKNNCTNSRPEGNAAWIFY